MSFHGGGGGGGGQLIIGKKTQNMARMHWISHLIHLVDYVYLVRIYDSLVATGDR